MATRKVKTKVGIFLLACFGLIGTSVAYISGTYRPEGVPYWLEFEDSVLGVYEGGIVQYLGVPVGKVTNISVTPTNRAHIEISINRDKIELQRGVEAQLVLYSLAAGTMAIELSGGKAADGPLPPNSQIPARASAFASISTKVEELVDDAASIVGIFEEGMRDMEPGWLAEMIESAKAAIEQVESLTVEFTATIKTTNGTIQKIEGKIDPLTDEVIALSQDLRATSEDASEFLRVATAKAGDLDVKGLGGKIDQIMEEITGLTVQLRSSVENLDESSASMLHEADNIEYSLRTTLQSTSETLITLESLLNQLKEDPSSLVRGRGKVKE